MALTSDQIEFRLRVVITEDYIPCLQVLIGDSEDAVTLPLSNTQALNLAEALKAAANFHPNDIPKLRLN